MSLTCVALLQLTSTTRLICTCPCPVLPVRRIVYAQSHFLLDHLYELLHPPVSQQRPTVMYFNYGYDVFCRMRGAGASSAGNAPPLTLADISFAPVRPEALFRSDLADPTAHLLIDLGLAGAPAGSSIVLPVCAANVVAVGSPSACNSDYVKAWVSKMQALERRYLPVAPLDVLEECRRLTCPTVAEEAADRALPAGHPRALLPGEAYRGNFSKVEFDLRFARYGGIARSCFDTTNSELDDRLRDVLNNCSLKEIVKGTLDGKLDHLHRHSSMLLHYLVFDSDTLTAAQRQLVLLAERAKLGLITDAAASAAALAAPRPAALPFCLLDTSLKFASRWMKDQLYEKYQAKRQLEVSEFLSDCLDNPALFRVRHDFFESHAHGIMRRGGVRLFTQQLDPSNGGRIGAVTTKLFTVTGATHWITQLADFATLSENQYGRPSNDNWHTLDAVLAPDISLQYTTSNTHSVVEGGLHDAEAQLHALADARAAAAAAAALAAGAPAPAAAPFRLHHYFGVPPDRFNSFILRWADFTPTVGKPRPANVDYYVVMLEDPQVTAHRMQKVTMHTIGRPQANVHVDMQRIALRGSVSVYVCN
jgi:hypothetical protein